MEYFHKFIVKMQVHKNKNETKERKSSHCTLGNQDNVRQVSLEYTSVSCLLHNRYRYRLFFLRSIAQFFTQIYMNMLNKLGKFW